MINIVNRCHGIYLKYIKKWLPLICLTFWVVFSFFNYYMSNYYIDETWAWNIASDLNFFEIIKLMHYEGHTFLWYLVLKPFTYFPNLYPDILKYINWSISFAVMIVFWKFTPLNDLIKVLVTFSAPFLITYSTYARPYSMAILFLLILVLLYKERLNKPFMYSIVTFLAMNSCLNGAIFAGILGLFFLYDIIKQEKEEGGKKYIFPIIITMLSYLSLIVQWIPFYIPDYTEYYDKFVMLKKFFFCDDFFYNLIAFIVFFPLLQIIFYYITANFNDKRYSVFSLLVINCTLFFYMFIYSASDYHLYFLYVYFILIYILLLENCVDFKEKKIVYQLCTGFIIVISLLFNYTLKDMARIGFSFESKDTIEQAAKIIKENVPKGAEIYIGGTENELFPYLKKDYNLVNIYGEKFSTYKAYRHTYIKKDKKMMKKLESADYYILRADCKPEFVEEFNLILLDTYVMGHKSK